MSPDDPRHGTEAGNEQHARDQEDPCDDCYQAKLVSSRRRSKRKAMGYAYTVPNERAREIVLRWREGGASFRDIAEHTGVAESRLWDIADDANPRIYARNALKIMSAEPWPVTAMGITRRIRALARQGWGIRKIAEVAGVDHDTILDARRQQRQFMSRRTGLAIVAAYELLADTPASGSQRGVSRVRNEAIRNGWAAPWAWDNIDNPNEMPKLNDERAVEIDPVVVNRLLAGQRVQSNRAEKVEAMRRWLAAGKSESSLCVAHGWQASRYVDRSDGAA